jgi:hypothetical protein
MTDGERHLWPDASINQLLDLALLQGNRFIKEFLRSRDLPIGTNKEQFEHHLRDAISEGRLTPSDVQEWLNEVEGWGNQQVFAFDVPVGDADAVRDRAEFTRLLAGAGISDLLDAEIPLDPADELSLATIRHSSEGVSLLWVRGNPALIRRKDLDYEEELEGDEIEFHAYERRWSRVAARFEWHFDADLAAVFLARREERDYAQQRDMVLQTVDAVIPARADWSTLDVSRVITQLDSAALDAAQRANEQHSVRMSSTVFQGTSASVRLAATSEVSSYQDDAGVRQVRLAVDPAQLIGGSGDCYLTPRDKNSEERELHMRLYGREGRVLLWGKMTAEEVWGLITDLRAYATA